MSSKILVADDSLTIQKVIGITLANSGYQLVECLNEEDLIRKVSTEKFDLVLIDFNLSDTNSGYDLSFLVKKHLPGAGVIVMLGTFDTVDDSKFEEFGINDKIVKPFESAKFIKKCKDVLENNSGKVFDFKNSPIQSKNNRDHSDFSVENDLGGWVVDAPTPSERVAEITQELELDDQLETLDPLNSEIKGWGFNTEAGESLEDRYNKTFPPVINETIESHVVERLQFSSAFILEDELEVITENDLTKEEITTETDENKSVFDLPLNLKQSLINEIEEEVSPEAFWAVDEVVPLKSEESELIEETKLDEVTADLTDKLKAFKDNQEVQAGLKTETIEPKIEKVVIEKIVTEKIDIDQIVARLKAELLPHLETIVRDYCRETAEKVSWEVIPDLAENLIKKEIKEISESVH